MHPRMATRFFTISYKPIGHRMLIFSAHEGDVMTREGDTRGQNGSY
jgi:hypothetical protein